MKDKIKRFTIPTLLILLNFLSFFNYQTFIFIYIFLVIFFVFKNYELIGINNFMFKLIPVSYFINNFLSTYLENPKSSIFWDMQNFLHYLSCNVNLTKYSYKLDNTYKNCPDSIGYGPLTEFIPFNHGLIWETTVVIFFLTIFVFFVFLQKTTSLKIVVVTSLLSPGIHFLLFSLNSDIFVLFYIIFLLYKKKLSYNLINFLILSLLTQIKIYTIALFLGYALIFFKKKEFKNFSYSITFFTINLTVIIYHYILQSSPIPEPISYTRSFGVLHDFILLNQYIGIERLVYFLGIMLILLVLYRKKIIKYIVNFNIVLNQENKERVIFLLPLIVLINTYQNWGYKFVFSSLIIVLIFNSLNNHNKAFLILLTLFSTTYYVIGWGYENTPINLALIVFSKFLFYSSYIFSINLLYKLTIKK